MLRRDSVAKVVARLVIGCAEMELATVVHETFFAMVPKHRRTGSMLNMKRSSFGSTETNFTGGFGRRTVPSTSSIDSNLAMLPKLHLLHGNHNSQLTSLPT